MNNMVGINVTNLMSRPLKNEGNKSVKIYVYGVYRDGKLIYYFPSKKQLIEKETIKRVSELDENWRMKEIKSFLGVAFYNINGYEQRQEAKKQKKKQKKENRKNNVLKKKEKRKNILQIEKKLNIEINSLNKINNKIQKNLNKINKLQIENKILLNNKSSNKNIFINKIKYLKNRKAKLEIKRKSIKLFRNKKHKKTQSQQIVQAKQ